MEDTIQIVRELDTSLTYSFYLIGSKGMVGVWHLNKTQYYCYNHTRLRESPSRKESSELEVLICLGIEAKEVYRMGLELRNGETGTIPKRAQ